jgi:hypothetical protein
MIKILSEILYSILLTPFLATGLFIIIFILLRLLYGKEYLNKFNDITSEFLRSFLLFLSFCLLFLYFNMKDYWGNDTIGSFFSKYKYQTEYYVQLFPENSDSKNYLVSAELEIDSDSIYIIRVKWPNEGYTNFDIENQQPEKFYRNKKITYTDDQNRNWTIILTNSKSKTP